MQSHPQNGANAKILLGENDFLIAKRLLPENIDTLLHYIYNNKNMRLYNE